MPTSEEATTINRSPAVVWEYLTVTENVPTFENQVIYLDQMTPGPVGLGTRWRGAHNVLGRTVEWTTEVIEFEPCRRMVVRSIEGKVAFTVAYTLDPDEAGGDHVLLPDRRRPRPRRRIRHAHDSVRRPCVLPDRAHQPRDSEGAARVWRTC